MFQQNHRVVFNKITSGNIWRTIRSMATNANIIKMCCTLGKLILLMSGIKPVEKIIDSVQNKNRDGNRNF